MTLKDLHNKAVKRVNWKKIYSDYGVTLPPLQTQDNDGWMKCKSVVLATRDFQINAITGDWKAPSLQKDGSIYDYMVECNFSESGRKGNIKTLKILCRYADLEGDFYSCVREGKPSRSLSKNQFKKMMENVDSDFIARLCTETSLSSKTIRRYKVGALPTDQGLVPVIPIINQDGTSTMPLWYDSATYQEQHCRPGQFAGISTLRRKYESGLYELKGEHWTHVVVCGHEIDRLLIMQERPDDRWGAISLYGLKVNDAVFDFLAERNVYVCMPEDHNAKKIYKNILWPKLKKMMSAGEVLRALKINLPVDGSPTDRFLFQWWTNFGSWEAFEALIKSGTEITGESYEDDDDPVELESLSQIDADRFLDVKVRCTVRLTGETSIPFDSPNKFRVDYCPLIESGRCLKCQGQIYKISDCDPMHIMAFGSMDHHLEKQCGKFCCHLGKRPKIEILERVGFKELLVIPDDDKVYAPRRVYLKTDENYNLNPGRYTLTGKVRTSSRNQERTLICNEIEKKNEEYEDFDLDENIDNLKKAKELGPDKLLDLISNSITKIYERPEMHLVAMLAYCSPLKIKLHGEVLRGWVNAVLVGNTGTGKSDIFEKISNAVGAGHIFHCPTGKRTGLVYSIAKSKEGGWICQAGSYPLSTGTILCIEEPQVMHEDDLKTIGIAMDRGVLQIEAVAKATYRTETRLVFNCNPKFDKSIDQYECGVEALKTLFKKMMIRRVDIALAIGSSKKVDYDLRSTEDVEFDTDILKALIFWSWNLTPARIKLELTVDAINKRAAQLSDRFGSAYDIPLVCPSDIRKTLLRLSTSYAALSASSDDDFKTLTVFPEHVNYVADFMNEQYSGPDMLLDVYSNKYFALTNVMDNYRNIEEKIIKFVESFDSLADNPGIRFFRALYSANLDEDKAREEIPHYAGWIRTFIGLGIIEYDEQENIIQTPKFERALDRFLKKNKKYARRFKTCK